MIEFLFKLLFNPTALLVWLAFAGLMAAVWFMFGPVRFWEMLRSWKTWAIVAAVAFGLSYASLDRKVEDLTEQVETQQHHSDAKDDVIDVLDNRARRADRARENQSRQQEAIADAEPGQELDALLDEIARQQGDPLHRGGGAAAQPERVRNDADGVVLP